MHMGLNKMDAKLVCYLKNSAKFESQCLMEKAWDSMRWHAATV